jgi:hypothetical protein
LCIHARQHEAQAAVLERMRQLVEARVLGTAARGKLADAQGPHAGALDTGAPHLKLVLDHVARGERAVHRAEVGL